MKGDLKAAHKCLVWSRAITEKDHSAGWNFR